MTPAPSRDHVSGPSTALDRGFGTLTQASPPPVPRCGLERVCWSAEIPRQLRLLQWGGGRPRGQAGLRCHLERSACGRRGQASRGAHAGRSAARTWASLAATAPSRAGLTARGGSHSTSHVLRRSLGAQRPGHQDRDHRVLSVSGPRRAGLRRRGHGWTGRGARRGAWTGNLLDLDTFSKSDPMVVLYTQSRASQEWREFGRTEVIDNTLNPDFVRKFVLDYFFEEKQNLRFDVYNVDSRTNISKPKDFLGQAFLALGEVIGGQGSRVERPLKGVPGKKCGTILLTAEELSNCRDIATMQLCANKLDKKDFFGKSDPFLVFYRSNEDGTFTICHKTEVVKNTLNPVWQPFSIPVRALCNGDYDRTVKIDVYDWDRDGSHDFIGEFTTSYRELSKAQNQFTVYEVLNPRKKCKKKKYLNSGTVTLLSFSVDSEFTFVDYIKGGTQLNFTVAIDFTASNAKDPRASENTLVGGL
ncbi:copine-9 isoform X3 [Heterocephalus glaber]|uniref:Copine-9 n=1 Tax=Heterocephalus glaber TaxID=10181 RepID=A0AAX6T7Q0_HETGA|nr:copine-9 isoform X3 [Heterocephalus glaber]